MNIKSLDEIKEAYKERKELEEKIVELEYMRLSPRAAVYGTERVQTSMKGDIQPETLAALESLLKLYNEKLQRCCALTEEFERALETLKARERRLMRLYVMKGLTWERICFRMKISWSTLHRIRKLALKKIENA